MAKVVVMPKLGYTQDEGTIAEWHKQVGDPVCHRRPPSLTCTPTSR